MLWHIKRIYKPSHKNISQTLNTAAHGSVLENAHMSHSVMYRMGSTLCFFCKQNKLKIMRRNGNTCKK